MKRKIVRIDEEKCTGCGACAEACHENAIGMVDGKAKLLRDDYCDGLGDCLPACPADAISFEVREAAPYDEAAVAENKKKKDALHASAQSGGGCPGQRMQTFLQEDSLSGLRQPADANAPASCLRQWPVQIKLVPVQAPFFNDAELLVAADCTAYACAAFHETFMKGRVTLIGCTKLDAADYSDKLAEILKQNSIRGIHVVRMQVPCCGGMENAVRSAVLKSGRNISVQVSVLSSDGRILP